MGSVFLVFLRAGGLPSGRGHCVLFHQVDEGGI